MGKPRHADPLITTDACGPRMLLSSTDPAQWAKLKRNIMTTPLWDLPIAPRWRQILEEGWTTIPATPSPLTLAQATRQQSIMSARTRLPRDPTEGQAGHPPKIMLHFPSPPTKKGRQKKGRPQTQRPHHKRAPPRHRRQRRKRRHQTHIREMDTWRDASLATSNTSGHPLM